MLDDKGKRPISYLVEVSESQRTALLELLRRHEAEIEQEGHPLNYWIGALLALPATELEYPKIVHGLCL